MKHRGGFCLNRADQAVSRAGPAAGAVGAAAGGLQAAVLFAGFLVPAEELARGRKSPAGRFSDTVLHSQLSLSGLSQVTQTFHLQMHSADDARLLNDKSRQQKEKSSSELMRRRE